MPDLEPSGMRRGLWKAGARGRTVSAGGILSLAALAAALFAAGCGNFWQAPSSTGTGSTGSTGTTSTTTSLTPSSTSVTESDSISLTATVSPSAATGTVTFYDGSTSIGSSTVTSGTATLSATFTTTGTQSLTATYGGSSTYASSTSNAVTVTVTASTNPVAVRRRNSSLTSSTSVTREGGDYTASAYGTAAIETAGAFSATGGTYTAGDAEGAVVEGSGSVTLNGTALSGAAGDDRGVLLYESAAGGTNSVLTPAFTMTGGSLAYNCDAVSTPACGQGSTAEGQNHPATLFSIANATAAISLTDVQVTNNTATAEDENGVLLTAEALGSDAPAGTWGTAGANGGNVTFRAQGETLAGDVIVDGESTAELYVLMDSSGTGSTLTGAINGADTGKTVDLTLDPASLWMVTGTSYVTDLAGLAVSGGTVGNIDGGGHCVYYSGTVNGTGAGSGNSADGQGVYLLGGGGYLAPAGTTGLGCE
jgi:Bacterial Ig-like domain (group 3)